MSKEELREQREKTNAILTAAGRSTTGGEVTMTVADSMKHAKIFKKEISFVISATEALQARYPEGGDVLTSSSSSSSPAGGSAEAAAAGGGGGAGGEGKERWQRQDIQRAYKMLDVLRMAVTNGGVRANETGREEVRELHRSVEQVLSSLGVMMTPPPVVVAAAAARTTIGGTKQGSRGGESGSNTCCANRGTNGRRCGHPLGKKANTAMNTTRSKLQLMHRVLPGLWLGGWAALRNDCRELRCKNITHVLSVCSAAKRRLPSCFQHEHFTIDDREEAASQLFQYIPTALTFVEKARRGGGIVFVHCGAGISRSSTVVIAYVMWKEPSMSASRALSFVRAARACVRPNIGFIRELKKFEEGRKEVAMMM